MLTLSEERKFHLIYTKGSESSREQEFQGTKVPKSEMERKYVGTKVPVTPDPNLIPNPKPDPNPKCSRKKRKKTTKKHHCDSAKVRHIA